MRAYDFSPMLRSSIGFDRIAHFIEQASRAEAQTYPPYNIEMVSEDKYRIEMAVAGFDRDDLEINSENEVLRIEGRHKPAQTQDKRTFLHRGLAERNFRHQFQLAQHVKVAGASLKNGILCVDLVREVPEALKPRKIAIDEGNAHLELIEQKAA